MEDISSQSQLNKPKHSFDITRMNICTEGDIQMKHLLEKQMSTDITLHGELAKVKQFSRSTVYSMPTDRVAGLINSAEFSRLIEEGHKLDELRHCGLTDDEIYLKLKHDGSDTKQLQRKSHARRYGVDPTAQAEQLSVIEMKIAERERHLQEPTTFAGAKPMTRHEMDLEDAISHDRNASRLHRCLFIKKSSDSIDPDHPINHLDSILNEILPKPIDEKMRKRKRKRRVDTAVNSVEEEDVVCGNDKILASNSHCSQPEANLSYPDVIERTKKTKVKSSETEIDYDSIASIPVEVIENYKLSLSQIRELPRFRNYHPGVPSQTLYLKNLSSHVTEADLVSLFKRYSSSCQRVQIKLLHGKMKGQAFITFNSIDSASEALDLINGYDFKGKPIIIEFGKKRDVITEQSRTPSCEQTSNGHSVNNQEVCK